MKGNQLVSLYFDFRYFFNKVSFINISTLSSQGSAYFSFTLV